MYPQTLTIFEYISDCDELDLEEEIIKLKEKNHYNWEIII